MQMHEQSSFTNPNSLFFILGRGRSGTTLLSRMLSSHSQITVAPEGFFILSLWSKYRHKKWTPNVIEHFCKDLYRENRIKTWHLPFEKVRETLLSASSEQEFLTYPEVCRLVYQVYAHHNGESAIWVGDKNPHYALFAKELLKIFPDAPVLYLFRDFKTNIQSYQHVPFDLQDTAALAYRWKMYNEAILNVAKQNHTNFLNLPFETLLKHPEDQLSRVCRFLGVNFESEMLHFYKREADNFYGKGSPWFDKLNHPLKTNESQKPVNLAEDELKLARSICGNLAAGLGYEHEQTLPNITFKNKIKKGLGFCKAWGMVVLEKLLFYYLPFSLKMIIINKYRQGTGRV